LYALRIAINSSYAVLLRKFKEPTASINRNPYSVSRSTTLGFFSLGGIRFATRKFASSPLLLPLGCGLSCVRFFFDHCCCTSESDNACLDGSTRHHTETCTYFASTKRDLGLGLLVRCAPSILLEACTLLEIDVLFHLCSGGICLLLRGDGVRYVSE
jgi:hypothetical protein